MGVKEGVELVHLVDRIQLMVVVGAVEGNSDKKVVVAVEDLLIDQV